MGDLADTIKAVLIERDKQREAGASPAEVARNLEQTVRAAWPKGRPWKYLCSDCDDTGLLIYTCKAGQRCDGISQRVDSSQERPGKHTRLCARAPESSYEHTYGEACVCSAGRRFRSTPVQDQDMVLLAAKAPKKQPQRWGR